MSKKAVYLNGSGPDAAIMKGIQDAGYEVVTTHGIAETLAALDAALLLVAEVQAGGIALLCILNEQKSHADAPVMPAILFDRTGDQIQMAIKALQLGVKEYLLASDPEAQRELAARMWAERAPSLYGESAQPQARKTRTTKGDVAYEWDMASNIICAGDVYIRLSRLEGRLFNLLFAKRGHVVTVRELIDGALQRPEIDLVTGAECLRPHVMRLRRKVAVCPSLANRINSVRGSGYMLA